MDILLGKYGLIFTEFESIDLGSASDNIYWVKSPYLYNVTLYT